MPLPRYYQGRTYPGYLLVPWVHHAGQHDSSAVVLVRGVLHAAVRAFARTVGLRSAARGTLGCPGHAEGRGMPGQGVVPCPGYPGTERVRDGCLDSARV